jgi:hypothetical protein
VGHAGEDQAGFFAPGDDLDGKAQRRLGARQEIGGVARDPEGVGGHGPHPVGVEAAQAFAKALEHADSAVDGLVAQDLVLAQARGQPHGLFEAVDLVDLRHAILLDNAADG